MSGHALDYTVLIINTGCLYQGHSPLLFSTAYPNTKPVIRLTASCTTPLAMTNLFTPPSYGNLPPPPHTSRRVALGDEDATTTSVEFVTNLYSVH